MFCSLKLALSSKLIGGTDREQTYPNGEKEWKIGDIYYAISSIDRIVGVGLCIYTISSLLMSAHVKNSFDI